MKTKILVLIGSVAFAVLIAALVFSYGTNAFGFFIKKPDVDEISPKQWQYVKQSYVDMKKRNGYPDSLTVESVSVDEYCGSYKGSVVVMLSDDQTVYTTAITIDTVAGTRFQYSNSNTLLVWNDGELYTLEQAYSGRLLSKSDIKTIGVIHNKY